MTPEQIFNAAKAAAQVAAVTHDATLGPEAQRGFTCGFAWVIIRPARGPFVAYLKANKLGDPHYGGGYSIWYSKMHDVPTQSISTHEAAARAFCDVLVQHITGSVEVGSRLD